MATYDLMARTQSIEKVLALVKRVKTALEIHQLKI